MTRRVVLAVGLGILVLVIVPPFVGGTPVPEEPVAIGFEPQFFIDDYLVDNRWATNFRTELTHHVVHAPKKDERNPLVTGRGGYLNVVWDAEAQKFRMWYQVHEYSGEKPQKVNYAVAYAESKDGIAWDFPKLGKFDWEGTKENNVVLRGPRGSSVSSPFLMDLPAEQRRGYRFVLLYTLDDHDPANAGMRLVGSKDGIDWDIANDRLIARVYPDVFSSISWDPRSKEYVCFTRATSRYRQLTDRRRVFRMAGKDLWGEWSVRPESPLLPDRGEKWTIPLQSILIPDAEDARRGRNDFYGMATHYYAGIYWGFLLPYRLDHEVVTELAVSRDGKQFNRFRERTPLIDLGPKGAWDAGMVFSAPRWVEVGREWWIYYAASAGPHDDTKAKWGIGLARIRKEGFVSLSSPKGGGGVVTRSLLWPGGDLVVNADAKNGELRVRVTDEKRKEIAGFGAADCTPFAGEAVAHPVAWKVGRMDELKGRVIRLEFLMAGQVDLYTFRAGDKR